MRFRQPFRTAANDWFDNTMTTRLNDPKTGAYIIVMQRLHEDDLMGHLLARSGKIGPCCAFRHATNPTIRSCFLKDPRTEPGQLLWPARMGEPEVKKLETALGSYGAAGQLQQRPAPREGGMFKRQWFEVVPAAPLGLEEVRAWDLAGTVPEVGSDPDWTAAKIGRDADGFFWITDVQRFRNTPHVVEGAIKNTASQDGKRAAYGCRKTPAKRANRRRAALVRLLGGYLPCARCRPPAVRKRAQRRWRRRPKPGM
jgi:hypothetical protein